MGGENVSATWRRSNDTDAEYGYPFAQVIQISPPPAAKKGGNATTTLEHSAFEVMVTRGWLNKTLVKAEDRKHMKPAVWSVVMMEYSWTNASTSANSSRCSK